MSRIKIISDGTPETTRILDSDGGDIQGITKIEFDPIMPDGGFNKVRLTFEAYDLEMVAETKDESLPEMLREMLKVLDDAEGFMEGYGKDGVLYSEEGVKWGHKELSSLLKGVD